MVYGVYERSVVDYGVYLEFMRDIWGVYERSVVVYGIYRGSLRGLWWSMGSIGGL